MSFLISTSSVAWAETVDSNDLVQRQGLYYKKYSDAPFSGTATGRMQGTIKDGKQEGAWVIFYENGQLKSKGSLKNGKEEGAWVLFHSNGQLAGEGMYKQGVKVEDTWVYHKATILKDAIKEGGVVSGSGALQEKNKGAPAVSSRRTRTHPLID